MEGVERKQSGRGERQRRYETRGEGPGGARGRLAEYRPIAEEKAARVAVAGFC